MTENGKPVKNLSVLSSASADGIGTVLLIDSSNSMKGSIDSAMAAARAFAARNPGQPLSVVFFNAQPTVALPLTTDRKQVEAVLAKSPKLAEGTHINDALVAAVAQVRGSALGAARIVLLSDGDDVGSATSLDAALAQLDAQKIRVYTVGIQSPDFQSGDLQKIADQTGATYAAADSPEALTKIYDELGFKLGNEYLLRYRSGAEPDQPVAVNVKVVGRGARRVLVHEPLDRNRGAVPARVQATSCSSPGRWCRSSSGSCSRWPSSRSARCGASARTRRSSPASASS